MSVQRAQNYFDQVIRRLDFEAAHPKVHIAHQTAPLWHWIATWTDAEDSSRTTVDNELGGLLDQLDRHFPPDLP